MYAKNTAVSCDRSEAEIKATLIRYGADQFASLWGDGQAAIQFRVKGKMVRFNLPLPRTEDYKFRVDGRSGTPRELSPEIAMRDWEQACRQRWRALALGVKAKLAFVEANITTLEEEFMAHIVIPGHKGKTFGQIMLSRIDEAYQTGKAPQLGWEG